MYLPDDVRKFRRPEAPPPWRSRALRGCRSASIAVDPREEPQPTSDRRLFTARLFDQRGYAISLRSGAHGYYEADTDGDSRWEGEPETYLNVTFSMHADDLVDKGIPNMVTTVARVLAGRNEDAALIQDGNYLLLTRTNGVIRTHRTSWWNHYHLEHLITG
ncbi:SitI3 family protein [Micromonospora echinofusca]|uniref:SitI3 family protein n=1 Tax=Micromonospora echinofusca TaxID=47858 RepID=UPI0033FEBC6E